MADNAQATAEDSGLAAATLQDVQIVNHILSYLLHDTALPSELMRVSRSFKEATGYTRPDSMVICGRHTASSTQLDRLEASASSQSVRLTSAKRLKFIGTKISAQALEASLDNDKVQDSTRVSSTEKLNEVIVAASFGFVPTRVQLLTAQNERSEEGVVAVTPLACPLLRSLAKLSHLTSLVLADTTVAWPHGLVLPHVEVIGLTNSTLLVAGPRRYTPAQATALNWGNIPADANDDLAPSDLCASVAEIIHHWPRARHIFLGGCTVSIEPLNSRPALAGKQDWADKVKAPLQFVAPAMQHVMGVANPLIYSNRQNAGLVAVRWACLQLQLGTGMDVARPAGLSTSPTNGSGGPVPGQGWEHRAMDDPLVMELSHWAPDAVFALLLAVTGVGSSTRSSPAFPSAPAVLAGGEAGSHTAVFPPVLWYSLPGDEHNPMWALQPEDGNDPAPAAPAAPAAQAAEQAQGEGEGEADNAEAQQGEGQVQRLQEGRARPRLEAARIHPAATLFSHVLEGVRPYAHGAAGEPPSLRVQLQGLHATLMKQARVYSPLLPFVWGPAAACVADGVNPMLQPVAAYSDPAAAPPGTLPRTHATLRWVWPCLLHKWDALPDGRLPGWKGLLHAMRIALTAQGPLRRTILTQACARARDDIVTSTLAAWHGRLGERGRMGQEEEEEEEHRHSEGEGEGEGEGKEGGASLLEQQEPAEAIELSLYLERKDMRGNTPVLIAADVPVKLLAQSLDRSRVSRPVTPAGDWQEWWGQDDAFTNAEPHQFVDIVLERSVRILRSLLAYGASVAVTNHREESPLYLAAMKGNYKAVRALMGSEALVQACQAVSPAASSVAGAAATGAPSRPALPTSAQTMVRDPCMGADLWTALHAACMTDSKAVMDCLLGIADEDKEDAGDDTHRLSLTQSFMRQRMDTPTRQGQTPLHVAARIGAASCIKSLLAAGAAVNKADNTGRTALQIARTAKQAAAEAALLAAGASDKPSKKKG